MTSNSITLTSSKLAEVRIDFTTLLPNGKREEKSIVIPFRVSNTTQIGFTMVNYTDASGKPQQVEVQTNKTEITQSIVAAVNQNYASWKFSEVGPGKEGFPYGSAISTNETVFEYILTKDGPRLSRQTVEQYISSAQFAGGLSIDNYKGYEFLNGGSSVLINRVIREIRDFELNGKDVTETTESIWTARGETSEGKTYFAKRYKQIKSKLYDGGIVGLSYLVDSLKPLAFAGTQTSLEIGKNPVPIKPSDHEIARREITNGGST